MGKLSALTVNGGLARDQHSTLKATCLCMMTCGTDSMPIGVLLTDCVANPALAGLTVYHSHVLSVEAVDTALSAAVRRPTRGDRTMMIPRHRNGYHTFRRGDILVYKPAAKGPEEPEDSDGAGTQEICYGVMVVQYRKAQQLRFTV